MNRGAFPTAIKITSAVLLISATAMASSIQASAGYAIVGSSFIPGTAQIISMGMSPTTFDNGLLTVTPSVTPDPTDPNSQWINFQVQPTNSVFSLLGTSGLFEIPLSIVPLDTSAMFTGFEASFTGGSSAGTPPLSFAGTTSLASVAVLFDITTYSGSGGTSSFTVGVRETNGSPGHNPPPPVTNPSPVTDPPPVPDPPPSNAPEPATAGLAGLALIVIGFGARRWKING